MLNGEQILDGKGQPLPDPTPAENFSYVLGFDPSKLTTLERWNRMHAQAQTEQEAEVKRITADILGRLKLDPEDAQRRLDEIAEQQGEKPEVLALRIGKQAADQVFPEDVRQGLNAKTGQHLMDVAKSLGVTLPQATNVARQTYIGNVMDMLGVRGKEATERMWEMDRQAGEGDYVPFQARMR